MSKPRSAFDITLSTEQRDCLAHWLTNEYNNALAARSALDVEVDYWHQLYEQARTRTQGNLPWPDAADLTSYIACEKADSIHARIMETIFTDPVWTVEGWGASSDRAPFVEEFHQFKVEEERFQSVADKLALIALIEPRGLLEVYESSERRTSRKTIHAKPKMTPEGGIVYDEKGSPQLEQDERGNFIEAKAEESAFTTTIDSHDVVRSGPQYRVLPYRDSLVCPGHARDKEEIWGYAKRIWPRLGDLRMKAKDGIYDADAVAQLTETGDREPDQALQRAGHDVAPQWKQTAEKELWEGLILVDVNSILSTYGVAPIKGLKEGARWYLVTLHLKQSVLLRWNHDDFERSRYVLLNLFPRTDRVTEGFSLIGHKLITTVEEHTAYRNMGADASAMAINRPLMKLQGALWDEEEDPLGPKSVIPVRSPNEITQLQIADVPNSIEMGIQRAERTAERLSGVNDIASGASNDATPTTLGEEQMRTAASETRIKLIVKRFQEAMEDVWQIRHAIWKRTLAESPDGIDAPESVLIGLEGRGVPIEDYMPNGKITAAMLDGSFRGKPYGSVETADLNRQKGNLLQMMQALALAKQTFPLLTPMFATPRAARAIARQILRVFRVPNPQAFLGSPSQDMQAQLQVNMMPLGSTIPAPPPMLGSPAGLGSAPGGPPMASGPMPPMAPPPGGMPVH